MALLGGGLGRTLVRILAWPLELRGRAAAEREGDEPADAIVVLGAPLDPSGVLPAGTEERAAAALAMWRGARAEVLCLVGGHVPAGHERSEIERQGVAAWFRHQGVPEAALRVDRASRSTRENARCAAALLFPEGRRRVWLVTQRFHLRRSVLLFRRAGFAPRPFRIEGGVMETEPGWALRQVVREYGAWGLLVVRTIHDKMRGELPST